MCFLGEKDRNERARRMLSCKVCSKKYHRSCLKSWAQNRDLFHWSSWTCPSCRTCEICRKAGDPSKFMFCRRCDGAYHCYCLHPPHKENIITVLGLGNYCPICLKVYRDSASSSIVREVIRYASQIATCRVVYLHGISYNILAIHFYEKMSFKCIRRLQSFYLIGGRHYDSYLFVYYVNGSRSPCLSLELAAATMGYTKTSLKTVAAKLRKDEEKKARRWPICKETNI